MSYVEQEGRRATSSEPVSAQQRIALGLLARGPLYRYPGQGWQSRAFPGEQAHASSILALEARGWCHVELLPLPDIEIEVARLTHDGRAVYRGVRGLYADALDRPPLPATAEQVLAEMEAALALVEIETERLTVAGEAHLAEMAELRAKVTRCEEHAQETLARLARLEAARQIIARNRVAAVGIIAGMAASPPRVTEARS